MATMKDVAKLAGVSVSTVSNIVNKAKTVNSSIVKRVEDAMYELGYSPNASAQGLRSKKNNLFGVVIPDITDSIYMDYLRGIEELAQSKNYRVEVYTTGDLPALEIEALNKLYSQKAEVVFLTTCQKDNMDFIEYLMEKEMKFIFARRKPNLSKDFVYIGIDEYSAIYNGVTKLAFNGTKTMAFIGLSEQYSNELSCKRAFIDASQEFNINITNITHTHMGKERVFKIITEWIQANSMPEVILTTSTKLAEGGQAAIDFFSKNSNTKIYALKGFTWTQLFSNMERFTLSENYYKMGIEACQKAFDLLQKGSFDLTSNIMLPVKKKILTANIQNNSMDVTTPIRLLFIEGIHTEAIKLLSYKFKKECNVDIVIDHISFDEYYKNLDQYLETYDIIQIEQPLISKLVQEKKLLNLTDTIISQKIGQLFPEQIIEIYAKERSELYAVPLLVDTQLLFYRNDIFENTHLKRLFYEQYKKELLPPNTWSECSLIAHFLTKDSNEFSPVDYGIAMSTSPHELPYEFMSILWEANQNSSKELYVFDKDSILTALEMVHLLFKCSNSDSHYTSEEKKIQTYNSGNAAMMVLYRSKFFNYSYAHTSNSAGIVETTYAKRSLGPTSVRGGWSLGVSSNSQHKDLCASFLNWFISDEVTIPNNVLGGSMPSIQAITNDELNLISSWIGLSAEIVPETKPMANHLKEYSQHALCNDLSIAIKSFLEKEVSIEEACESIYMLLSNLN